MQLPNILNDMFDESRDIYEQAMSSEASKVFNVVQDVDGARLTCSSTWKATYEDLKLCGNIYKNQWGQLE